MDKQISIITFETNLTKKDNVDEIEKQLQKTVDITSDFLNNAFQIDFNRLFEKYVSQNTGVKGFISSELERVKSVTQSTIEDFVNSDKSMNLITDAQMNALAEKNKESINKMDQIIRSLNHSMDMANRKIKTLETEIENEKKLNNEYHIWGFIGFVVMGVWIASAISSNNKINADLKKILNDASYQLRRINRF
jgi:hypothetical protein